MKAAFSIRRQVVVGVMLGSFLVTGCSDVTAPLRALGGVALSIGGCPSHLENDQGWCADEVTFITGLINAMAANGTGACIQMRDVMQGWFASGMIRKSRVS